MVMRIEAYKVWSFCFSVGVVWLAVVCACGPAAKASTTPRNLTSEERQWVVECAKHPGESFSAPNIVLRCAERARILGDNGWL